jgi:hypothetical protein
VPSAESNFLNPDFEEPPMQKIIASGLVVTATLLAAAGCGEQTTRSTSVDKSIVSKNIDAQDFTAAAQETTKLMLADDRVQDTLRQIQSTLPPGQRPLIMITRVRNDTGQKINLIDYYATPIESVLLSSNKVDAVVQDRQTNSASAAQELLNGTQPRVAQLTLYGVVSKLSSYNDGTSQNVYTFQLTLADARTGSKVFIGLPRQFVKQTK